MLNKGPVLGRSRLTSSDHNGPDPFLVRPTSPVQIFGFPQTPRDPSPGVGNRGYASGVGSVETPDVRFSWVIHPIPGLDSLRTKKHRTLGSLPLCDGVPVCHPRSRKGRWEYTHPGDP